MIKRKGDYIAVKVLEESNLEEGDVWIACSNDGSRHLRFREYHIRDIELPSQQKYKIIGLLSDLGGLGRVHFQRLFNIPNEEFKEWLIIKKI